MYELIETKNNDISSYGIKCGNAVSYTHLDVYKRQT